MEKDLYREMAELENAHWWFKARRRIVLKLVDFYLQGVDDPRFLDIGCGTGSLLAELEIRGTAVGVDASPDALLFASKKTSARLIEAEVPGGLDEIEGGFDCLLMLDLLEHLDDDVDALASTYRLLAPGGIAVITVPAYRWLYAPRDEYHHHRRRYVRKDLEVLLDYAGLNMLFLSYYNTFLFAPAALSRLISKARREDPGPDLSLPRPWINRLLEAAFASERHLFPRLSLPFGLSLISVARR